MHPSCRMFQALAQGGTKRIIQYAQTGLTGLGTHPAPRPTLLTIYNKTLQELQGFPSDSAYRTATENITKHRKKIVEDVQPIGWANYLSQLEKKNMKAPTYSGDLVRETISADTINAIWSEESGFDKEGDPTGELQPEGPSKRVVGVNMTPSTRLNKQVEEIREPNLTIEQVHDIETKIGGGLIEEIIEVAYDELQLIKVMQQEKPWEPLVEQPVEGQWTYFERKTT